MRGLCRAALVAALVAMAAHPQAGRAQTDPAPQGTATLPSPVLTIDSDRLFAGSAFGKAAIARLQAAEAALVAENSRIEAELTAEEERLTRQRAELPADEFRALAEGFDTRVEEIRATQDAKSRVLTQQRDDDRRRFLETAVPILGKLMGDLGAVAILDKQTIFLSFDRIDVTDAAIARIDSELGDGSTPPPETAPPQP